MLRRTLWSLCLLALLVVLQTQRVEANPMISAPFVTVAAGDTFTISISITEAVDLESFQFDLGFDPLKVSANVAGATAGANLPVDWLFTSPGTVDNTGGQILGVSAFSAFGSPFSGSGEIAEIEFTALMAGGSPLALSNVFLNFSDLDVDISNGQIAVPEPTTLALLAIGLLAFGTRRPAARAWRIAN
jgi:hypothetical protein